MFSTPSSSPSPFFVLVREICGKANRKLGFVKRVLGKFDMKVKERSYAYVFSEASSGICNLPVGPI